MLDYFAQLTVPKRLDLNNGIHATAEIGGLLGLSNFVWDNTHDWFDHWLKGEANGIMDGPAVTMKKKFSKRAGQLSELARAAGHDSNILSEAARALFEWRDSIRAE